MSRLRHVLDAGPVVVVAALLVVVFDADPLVALVLSVFGVGTVRRRQGDRDDGDAVDEAHAAYVAGEIGEEELERRLDAALDPETERIREAVTPINGVGPSTAAALHREFGTLEAVARADRDELAHAHGVGPSTAEAIRSRFE